jgi:hypothetical protein
MLAAHGIIHHSSTQDRLFLLAASFFVPTKCWMLDAGCWQLAAHGIIHHSSTQDRSFLLAASFFVFIVKWLQTWHNTAMSKNLKHSGTVLTLFHWWLMCTFCSLLSPLSSMTGILVSAAPLHVTRGWSVVPGCLDLPQILGNWTLNKY